VNFSPVVAEEILIRNIWTKYGSWLIFFASRDVMLMSKCLTGTNRLIPIGAASCYPASIVNLIWFANEKCLSCQHWATWKHEIGHPVIQKLNILQACCDSALSCLNMWKTNYPHRHINLITLHVFGLQQ